MKIYKIPDGFKIIELNNENITENELAELFELSLDKWRESYHMLPKPTFEYFKYQFKKKYPFYKIFNFVIKNNQNEVIGSSYIRITPPDSDAPDSEKKRANAMIRLKKKYRRRGIGKACLLKLLETIDGLGIEKITMGTPVDCGQKFCQHFGGEITDKSVTNYLDLKTANWSEIQRINSNIKDDNDGISLEIIDKLTEGNIEEYIRQTAKYLKEVSEYSNDWEFDEDFFIKESRINIPDSIKGGVKRIITYAWSEQKIVGISVLRSDPFEPKEVYTVISGVDKNQRKRGICKLMKTELLLHVKKNYPEHSVVTTSNDEENSAIRTTNKRLGFKELPVWKAYSFKIENLKSRLEE